MAFDIASSCRWAQSLLKDATTPKFFSVEIARPGLPRGEGPSATIHGESMRVVELTLTNPIELHVLHVRIWRQLHTSGEEARELEAMVINSQVLDLFYGAFTAGGRIRAIDVGGIYGTSLEASFSEETVEGIEYHIADITLPLIVDSATALAA